MLTHRWAKNALHYEYLSLPLATLDECIGLFSTVESLAFNHIPGLAD
jgi:hypothetical protein